MIKFKQRLVEIKNSFDGLFESNIEEKIEAAINLITPSLELRLPMLVCGNGGSAADAMHITGELVGRFLLDRKALNVICLSTNISVITAWANDYEYESIFSRQVEAHGIDGGIIFCISTSGNSKNVVNALMKAKQMGLKTIGLTGMGGGLMAEYCDILIDTPSTSTPRIQEMHLIIYHYICECIEASFNSD
jgi:D-sedoheptulose 7-phosphate isomerase